MTGKPKFSTYPSRPERKDKAMKRFFVLAGVVLALVCFSVDVYAESIGEFKHHQVKGNGSHSSYGFLREIKTVTSAYTLKDADCGKTISNVGATADVALTWGTHQNGFWVTINADATAGGSGYTMSVNPPDAATIELETNAAGDRISTESGGICFDLLQISSTSIVIPHLPAATSSISDED